MGWNHHLAIDMRWWLYSSSRNQPVKTPWKSMSRRWEAILFGWPFFVLGELAVSFRKGMLPSKNGIEVHGAKLESGRCLSATRTALFIGSSRSFSFMNSSTKKGKPTGEEAFSKKATLWKIAHFEPNNGALVQMSFLFNFLGWFFGSSR